MWTLLKTFLVKNRMVRYALLLAIGIGVGSFLMLPKLNQAKGKIIALEDQSEKDEERFIKLNEVVVELALRENIKIENNIEGVKLKRGSSLVFSPESKAELTNIDTSQIEVVIDSVPVPETRSWFGRNISSIFRKKE